MNNKLRILAAKCQLPVVVRYSNSGRNGFEARIIIANNDITDKLSNLSNLIEEECLKEVNQIANDTNTHIEKWKLLIESSEKSFKELEEKYIALFDNYHKISKDLEVYKRALIKSNQIPWYKKLMGYR